MLPEERGTSDMIAEKSEATERFNPLDMPLMFRFPRYYSEYSAWLTHVPFAFALVTMLRPRRIVELGTYAGDSYCAFCQAVDILKLETQCAAVDTWKGDEHAGMYGPEILAMLRRRHDPSYGRFSTLIQSTFDDAVGKFEAGSIDLLHIDGLHSYEAVRHDFETWLPKVSPTGVVLFHDTAERREGFGVYRFWEELMGRHVGFAFLHGHGLGVLFPNQVPSGIKAFLAAGKENTEDIRTMFESLGRRVELEREWAKLSVRLKGDKSLFQRIENLMLGPRRA